MDNKMGNQQITSHQFAWLAGIWDGEGSFSIVRTKKDFYVGRLTLSNTCPIMVNEIVKILDNVGTGGHIWQETTSRKPNHKKAYHITINKIDHVKKIVELMLPYLISKKARAELLLRFVNSRVKYKKIFARDDKTGRSLGTIKQGYSEEEKTLFEQLRELNTVGIKEGISETIC